MLAVADEQESGEVSELSGRYAALTRRLVDSVLLTSGHTSSELRRGIEAQAARIGGRRTPPAPGDVGDGVPASLSGYVDKVARHAYKVTDDDVAALQRVGNSDDVLFEVTVAAALGGALARLERGLAALRREVPD
jgi:alkylhydroperoxidase family enzyme